MATDEEKRLLKRIIISQWDLRQAADCLSEVLNRNLHDSPSEKTLLKCLNTAFVVSYARPWTKNHGWDVRARLPKRYLSVLSKNQRDLHQEIITSRNRDQAHSDESGSCLMVHTMKMCDNIVANPYGNNPLTPWPRKSMEEVSEIIHALDLKLVEEQCRIQETLTSGEIF